jgi:hypothetical protein
MPDFALDDCNRLAWPFYVCLDTERITRIAKFGHVLYCSLCGNIPPMWGILFNPKSAHSLKTSTGTHHLIAKFWHDLLFVIPSHIKHLL